MKVTVYPSAREFLDVTGGLFRRDEARYGLIYGIARLTEENPHRYGKEDPWFCTVSDGTNITVSAWRTPPFYLGLAWHSGDAGAAVSAIIKSVRKRWTILPGVTGHREAVEPFAEAWCARYGTGIMTTMSQRLYRLDRIRDITPVSGRLRLATMAEKDVLTRWLIGFDVDCFGEAAASHPRLDITPTVEQGNLYLWEDNGTPVSLCGKTRATDHGMTIGPVYTPPEHRGKGYATTCVAAVCREIFRSGKEFCMLYADAANPISNAVYITIGFKPVGDSVEYAFKIPE